MKVIGCVLAFLLSAISQSTAEVPQDVVYIAPEILGKIPVTIPVNYSGWLSVGERASVTVDGGVLIFEKINLDFTNGNLSSGVVNGIFCTTVQGETLDIRFEGMELVSDGKDFGLVARSVNVNAPPIELPTMDLSIASVSIDLSDSSNLESCSGKPPSWKGLVIERGLVNKFFNVTSLNRAPVVSFEIENYPLELVRGKLEGSFIAAKQSDLILAEPAGTVLRVSSGRAIVKDGKFIGASVDGFVCLPDQLLTEIASDPGMIEARVSPLGGGCQDGQGNQQLQERIIQYTGASIDDSGNFYVASLTLPKTGFLNDMFAIEATNVTIDFSDLNSPSPKPNTWHGVYFQTGSLYFSFWQDKTITFQNFFFGSDGLNGTVSITGTAQNPIFTITLGGFSIRFTKIQVTFANTHITTPCQIDAVARIPFGGQDRDIGISVAVGDSGMQSVTANATPPITWNILNGAIVVSISQASFIRNPEPWQLSIDGSVQVNVSGKVTMNSAVSFTGLTIDGDGKVTVVQLWVTFGNGININVAGANIAIQKIGFGKGNSNYNVVNDNAKFWIGFDASVSFGTDSGIGAGASGVKVWFDRAASSPHSLSFDKVTCSSFSISYNQNGVSFYGSIEFKQNGFGAHIQGSVQSANVGFGGEFECGQAGGGYKYWRVFVEFTIGSTGIPLSPIPLSLYGGGGGFAWNMSVSLDSNNHAVFSPDEGTWSLTIAAHIGTSDAHYTWFCKAKLIIQFNPFKLILQGDSWFMKTGVPSPPADLSISIVIDSQGVTIMGSMNLDVKIGTLKASNNAIHMFFGQNGDWHIYIGQKSNRITLYILGADRGGAYLEIKPNSCELGAYIEASLDTGFDCYRRIRVQAGFTAGIDITFQLKPTYFSAHAWFICWLSVDYHCHGHAVLHKNCHDDGCGSYGDSKGHGIWHNLISGSGSFEVYAYVYGSDYGGGRRIEASFSGSVSINIADVISTTAGVSGSFTKYF